MSVFFLIVLPCSPRIIGLIDVLFFYFDCFFVQKKGGPVLMHSTLGELLRSLEIPGDFKIPDLLIMSREGMFVAKVSTKIILTLLTVLEQIRK